MMLFIIIILMIILSLSLSSTISIRGGNTVQLLPITMAKSFSTYTFNMNTCTLQKVESNDDGTGWVNPMSFDSLYFPKDLPPPKTTPAIGVCVVQGVPRYIMPSIILELETPDRIWRNRGLNSLPRASSWIDLFSPYVNIDSLSLSSFSKITSDVRFLEDQDGASSWQELGTKAMSFLKPETEAIRIGNTFKEFKELLKIGRPELQILNEGYSFVDIPIQGAIDYNLKSSLALKQFLTDFDDPRRLLEIENPEDLNSEAIGLLDIKIEVVAAGKTSKYLPEVYRSLYEDDNILYS